MKKSQIWGYIIFTFTARIQAWSSRATERLARKCWKCRKSPTATLLLCEYFKRPRFYNPSSTTTLPTTPILRVPKIPNCNPNNFFTCNYRSFHTSRTKLPSCKLPVSSCFSLPQSSFGPLRCQKSMITFKKPRSGTDIAVSIVTTISTIHWNAQATLFIWFTWSYIIYCQLSTSIIII